MLSKMVARKVSIVLAPVLIAAAVVLAVQGGLVKLPFGETVTKDRTDAAVLVQLTKLSEYHAAAGHYEVLVDLEQDTKWVPGWISGERVVLKAVGSVDAVVDFGKVGPGQIDIDDTRTKAAIVLPRPALADAVVDVDKTYIVNHDRGLAQKLGGGDDRTTEALKRGKVSIAEAASQTDDLVILAEGNTAAMLEGLLKSLGFTEVTVSYDDRDSRE